MRSDQETGRDVLSKDTVNINPFSIFIWLGYSELNITKYSDIGRFFSNRGANALQLIFSEIKVISNPN